MITTRDVKRGVRCFFFFFSSRRRHTRLQGDWSSDVCSSDLRLPARTETGTFRRCTWRGRALSARRWRDRKSTRLNSSHLVISYAVFCLKKKTHYLQHTIHKPGCERCHLHTPKPPSRSPPPA